MMFNQNMQQVSLIRGIEQDGGKSYPPDWPCNCGHLAEQHDFDEVAGKYTACLVKGGRKIEMAGQFWQDDCGEFKGIDNLTFVENLANAKLSK